MTYDIEVLDQAGKVQRTYLRDVVDRSWPGCCRLLIVAGGSITKTLPEQSRPVGTIRLIDPHLGRGSDGEFLHTITCRLGTTPQCGTDD
jgi:hypothetical protein